MLTNIPRSSLRAGGLHVSRVSAVRSPVHAKPAPTKASHYGQTRGFRFRPWSNYLDAEFQRQLRQRQHAAGYKYMESINRKLSWDPSMRGEDSRIVMKKMMAQCWIRHCHTHSKGKYVNDSKVKSGSDDASGARPGQNIEDVERSAINALFTGKRTSSYEYDLWQSPLQNIRNYLGNQTRGKSTTSASRSEESEIDPITNRKVQSMSAPESVFDNSSKAAHEPYFEDGPPPAEELKQYDQVPLDGTPWADAGSSGETPQYADLDKYKPVMDQKLDAEQLSEEPKYDDLDKYKPVGLRDFIEDTESEPKYEDLHKYANPSITEGPPEELSQPAYEDLDKYRPVMHNENAEVPAANEKYEDLGKYGPVMHNEKAIAEGADARSSYDDLHKYGPSGFNEPEGARPLSDEEKSKDYDDLHKYGPMGYNEPHGEPPVHPEEASKAYTDLDRYGPMAYREPHGQAPVHPEEASKVYTDLGKYEPVGWNEPHGKPPVHPEEAAKQYKDLGTYGPVAFKRGDGQLPESVIAPIAPEDMANHKPIQYDEPENQRPKPDWDQTTFDEAKKYQSYRYNEPDGQPIEQIDPVSKGLSDFDAELAAKANRRILNTYVTEQERADDLDLLRASDVRAKIPTSSGQSRRGYSTTNRQMLEADLPRYEVNWDISSKAARVSLRKAKSKAWENLQPKEDLIGNYVRDFPEDFSGSWSKVMTESLRAEDSKYQAPQGDEVEAASFDESFPRLEPALNRSSAFKSQAWVAGKQGLSDPYSTEPQGLEISYSEECNGRQTWPAYVRSYGTVADATAGSMSSAQEAVAAAKSEGVVSSTAKEPLREPVVYRILAYDPTMQAINTAETTSVVPDSATPLTPAEVLLRLSNPTKFFPYFSPLQKEGYEIVSGSGDVLVFRKVREAEVASGEQTTAPYAPTIEKPTTYQAPKVNPIDMMGSDPVVPSAYSSSPTGYLNYDYPGAEAENKPPPPFSSLSRQDTISCDSQDFKPSQRPKKSRAKRMILGAAWVGGISYAIGVVGEYFKTGGSDGRGPKGL
ncbi:conserved serine-threonine rich protein [Colletotrichum truncatum]|uniref:Conserved serine-threonine rich protein n=1 Tax=Colletotrichum truncatum TaxID=5467 RepID=A0ACC3YEY3_COLTU|nr:conserved serine-threonine rich protein [Colletotrichum truncatum]KAF6784979.1 conserved serine-threonine rich protein [Colletotrichum truncatum]